MDSDSSLASLALIFFLGVYVGVNLAEEALRRVRALGNGSSLGGAAKRVLSRWGQFATLLPRLRLVSVIGVALSTVALTMSIADSAWVVVIGVTVVFSVLLALRFALVGLGTRFSSPVLRVVSPMLLGVEWVFRPLLLALNRVTSRSTPTNGGRAMTANGGETPPLLSEDSMDVPLVQEAVEADEQEQRMIRGVLRLEDVTAREVMVPRVDIVAVQASAPLSGATDLMSDGGHSRIPVFEETIDRVVGIVHARDLLKYLGSETASVTLILKDIARPAVFIPESKPLDELLREFQERRVTIAVVVDEYGGTEGLITMEDLLEEIVGEIEDEFEREEPDVSRISDHEVIVDARVSLDEVNELFQANLEGDGFDTLGGLLYTRFGKIPASGDKLTLENLRMQVLSTAGRRIRKVRIQQQPSDQAGD